MKRLAALILALAALAGLAACGQQVESVAPADSDGVCSGTHLSAGQATSYTYTAPAGKLVASYCVKAGSANQGNGPEYHDVAPPQQSVTFSHSSGKEISHFSVELVDAPPPDTDPPTDTTTTEETTPSTSTAPPSSTTALTTTTLPPSTSSTTSTPSTTSDSPTTSTTTSTTLSSPPTTTGDPVPTAPLPSTPVQTTAAKPPSSAGTTASDFTPATQPEPFCTTHPSAEGCTSEGLITVETG